MATINGEYANWQSYVYINFIHSALNEEQLDLSLKTIQEMDAVRSELYTSEKYELAYLFMKQLVDLYDPDRREAAKISIQKILNILELVNTTNKTLYTDYLNIHQTKSERYLYRKP